MKNIHIVTEPESGAILAAFTQHGKASDFAAARFSGAKIVECRVNDTEQPVVREWELKSNG